jgi:hypothetical protein
MNHFAPHDLNATPAKIEVALRALGYCRSLTDPQSMGLPTSSCRPTRSLTALERGVESAALNVLRDYLNGEIDLGPVAELQRSAEADRGEAGLGSQCPFQITFPEDHDCEEAA